MAPFVAGPYRPVRAGRSLISESIFHWRDQQAIPMSDDHFIEIPPSFMALFMAPGRLKPNAPRELVASRYELCQDMANMLTEFAKNMLFSLGITEADVLSRCLQGFRGDAPVLSEAESDWVICRLAELLDWPRPAVGAGIRALGEKE